MPTTGTVIGIALLGLIAAAAARLYLRDAQNYRAGRGDERYAWLRRSHPNHPALPPAPPKPFLRMLRQRRGRRHLVIYAVQATAIACGMWLSLGEPWRNGETVPPKIYPLAFVVWVILVAFGTAVLTRLWDLSMAALARRRAGAGEHQQAVGEADGVLGARRRLGESA